MSPSTPTQLLLLLLLPATAITNTIILTKSQEIKNLFHLKFEKDTVYILFKLKYTRKIRRVLFFLA